MRANTPQCTGQPHSEALSAPSMSIASGLRHSGLGFRFRTVGVSTKAHFSPQKNAPNLASRVREPNQPGNLLLHHKAREP